MRVASHLMSAANFPCFASASFYGWVFGVDGAHCDRIAQLRPRLKGGLEGLYGWDCELGTVSGGARRGPGYASPQLTGPRVSAIPTVPKSRSVPTRGRDRGSGTVSRRAGSLAFAFPQATAPRVSAAHAGRPGASPQLTALPSSRRGRESVPKSESVPARGRDSDLGTVFGAARLALPLCQVIAWL